MFSRSIYTAADSKIFFFFTNEWYSIVFRCSFTRHTIVVLLVTFLVDNLREKGSLPRLNRQVLHVLNVLAARGLKISPSANRPVSVPVLHGLNCLVLSVSAPAFLTL